MAPRILRTLDGAGVRLTGPRRTVAAVLEDRTGRFTASQLLDESREKEPRIGRATVFRALDLFLDLGIVERFSLASGETGYVVCDPAEHHHHVVCERCGRSTDIDDRGVKALAKKIARRSGYRIDAHRLELTGLCPSCQKATA
jgi:Fur family ferric uptake transcriptional regulator